MQRHPVDPITMDRAAKTYPKLIPSDASPAQPHALDWQQPSDRALGTPLPKFVRAELDGFLRCQCWALRCQVLGRGFAHMV